ncbi:hypothetical protein [Algoriphagus sp. D3-2-R+10]|uniref:hypothetical protein n=1 Tax=Algoriphagus aurantiacus TaxID=3103948 RepID=UPI002B40B653|nr:hypothetical protein [Algoriphagus sp. D3-2-R+10]
MKSSLSTGRHDSSITQRDEYIPASTVSAHLLIFRARWAVAVAGQAAVPIVIRMWAKALLRLGFLPACPVGRVLLGQAKRT